MSQHNIRLEVMQAIEPKVDDFMKEYLSPIETIWQPSDFLPDPTRDDFFEKVTELRELAKELPYDFWAVLIGDTVTEEALPTYESWLMDVDGVGQTERNGWSRWVRAWTAEENRHGDVLSRYLYLSGRVNMREMEISAMHLIKDGFDIGTGRDPYRNFVYTSFQELATNFSHRRVAKLAQNFGNDMLSRMCGTIASDEARHARAYIQFIREVFVVDTSEMMLAFEDMMRKKIVMPAHFLRESGGKISELFTHFSDAAQRLKVYTSEDYVNILRQLLRTWEIDKQTSLTDKAERARDYLMALPDRLARLSDRIRIPEKSYEFKWIAG
ncbi:MAG: acyl-ACP desaturase [Bacteroidetes bacterium]|nr:MAG: acyl-ACP desaturase [Bacteroidota bacterium]